MQAVYAWFAAMFFLVGFHVCLLMPMDAASRDWLRSLLGWYVLPVGFTIGIVLYRLVENAKATRKS